MKVMTAVLTALVLTATCATAGSATDPYWQFTGKWSCISTNGSLVQTDFSEVSNSDWLSQATIFTNSGSRSWVQNFIRENPQRGDWVTVSFVSNGVTFQGRSPGFDKTGALTFSGVQQGPGGDYQAREIYSFQKGDGKLAHDWQVLARDGWKTSSTTTCSRTQ
jgi:hypothetical protein